MSVVTKRSSIPVAILAITLLTAIPPAQCEKLSTLKPDSVHRRQTVLHTGSGSIRWYESDEMWSYQLWVRVPCMRGENSERVCLCVNITHFFFWGNPQWLSALKEGLPQTAALNSALLGHHLQSGDRGRVSAPVQMWQQREFLGLMSFLLPIQCTAWVGCECVCMCLDRQTGRDDELQGVSWPREESNYLNRKFKRNDEAKYTEMLINLIITFI